MRKLFIATFLMFFCSAFFGQAQEKVIPSTDIFIVLDNSGSMKTNDPGFFTKNVVSYFLNNVPDNFRVGIIIFAEQPELIVPLTDLKMKGEIERALERKVDYKGRYTDIASAVERALYELKEKGKKDAKKIVILLTDGFMDTGDPSKDVERLRWLKGELAQSGKDAGIKIFGIAFTEQADYELIQTLGQVTGGDYYRVFKPEEIRGAFNRISEAISKPEQEPPRPEKPPEEKVEPDKNWPIIVAIVSGLVAIGVVLVLFALLRKGVVRPIQDTAIPEASLVEDDESVMDKKVYKLDKPVITIGREPGDGIDISLGKETISALHAQIRYEDHNFYLVDMNSTNGTYLNGNRVTGKVPLRSGNVISFHRYRFKFVMPGQVELGGTRLDIQKGGTVMEVPREPGQPPQPPQGDIEEPQVKPSPSSQEDEEGTKLKQSMCPNHPSFRATELCPICKTAKCENCMIEKDGRRICRECAQKEE